MKKKILRKKKVLEREREREREDTIFVWKMSIKVFICEQKALNLTKEEEKNIKLQTNIIWKIVFNIQIRKVVWNYLGY